MVYGGKTTRATLSDRPRSSSYAAKQRSPLTHAGVEVNDAAQAASVRNVWVLIVIGMV